MENKSIKELITENPVGNCGELSDKILTYLYESRQLPKQVDKYTPEQKLLKKQIKERYDEAKELRTQLSNQIRDTYRALVELSNAQHNLTLITDELAEYKN